MKDQTEVLYNADCPICSREVNHYAKLSQQAALPITYDDLGDPERLALWGVTADDAAKRFHVRKGGHVVSGLHAFIILWREIPKTRWLARLFSLPGLFWVSDKVYDYTAAPLLFSMHKRRQAKSNARSSTAR
jgi:predicted DCC family thiol-disulfide oxidoreductase YuxK